MTYVKPIIQALETEVLSASCCSPCNTNGAGQPGGGATPAPTPCYVSIAGICML